MRKSPSVEERLEPALLELIRALVSRGRLNTVARYLGVSREALAHVIATEGKASRAGTILLIRARLAAPQGASK
jgi:hypothetical protein